MSGWDSHSVSSSFQNLGQPSVADDGSSSSGLSGISGGVPSLRLSQLQAKLLAFLRTYREDGAYVYREQLLANHAQHNHFLSVDIRTLESVDGGELLAALRARPAELMPLFERAAKQLVAMSQVPQPRLEDVPDVQIQLTNLESVTPIRDLDSSQVGQLMCVRGVCVSAGKLRVKATKLRLLCKGCRATKTITVNAGFGGARLPRRCDTGAGAAAEDTGGPSACPLDPYQVLPDSSEYVDQQRLKLQESPESVPTGEMPRHISVACDRYLAGKVKPGTRVCVVGIYSIFESRGGRGSGQAGAGVTLSSSSSNSGGGGRRGRGRGGATAVALRQPYIRALGVFSEGEASDLMAGKFRPEEEAAMEELARSSEDIYTRIMHSIAPAIYDSDDIKKAIACMLFGGSRKLLPDGMRLRGDVNVLLLGDPSTAKSQFLKFAVQVAPIGVYTSGKGSSAAGLTASVIRDPSSGEFQLEGGALVLADGGMVCIDEFDKMRVQDRVAIHEAMEQQTISIAKAGITTILNSRAAVLAAANPVFGRYDDTKSPGENIDFQTTILSRFDLIFIVRDKQNADRDQRLARYVIGVHRQRRGGGGAGASAAGAGSSRDSGRRAAGASEDAVGSTDAPADAIDIPTLKRYIAYARSRIFPRLTEEAAELLKSHYVDFRRKHNGGGGGGDDSGAKARNMTIPITVRQLEAIVRLSESLARMELSREATVEHVNEALRLFNVSTIQAAKSEFSDVPLGPQVMQKVRRCEQYVLRRVPIGSEMHVNHLKKYLSDRHYDENVMEQALMLLERRRQVQRFNQGRQIRRLA